MQVGCIACILYVCSGTASDWAAGELGIPYSYTIELPDTGTYGFILPASQIRGVAEEARDMVTAMLRDLTRRRG